MLKGMSLRGSLSTMSAEDVLDWMARRKLSAPVTFERRGLARTLVIEEGQIVWASCNRRDEQLGVILTRSGLVNERALADALEARAETGVPLGKVLLMSGLITEPDLVDILATKIRETVTDVITWNDGQFDVVPRTQPATGVIAQLGIEVCLTVARHRVPRRVKDATPELGLSPAEVELASRVDGRWDLLSLVKSASIREAEALLAFAHLAEVGVVELG
jgi:hypothetical protein